MFAHLTIVLTLAFAMLVNVQNIVARPSAFQPSEFLKMESDRPKTVNEEYNPHQPYMPSWSELESSQPLPGFIRILEKPIEDVNLDPLKVEEYPEPLPIPQALSTDEKGPTYKKSGSHYHMTICHFKICNMGRKRDTHNVLY